MPTIAVVGEVVADAVLPPDGIVDGAAHLTVHPGGGPANTAVARLRICVAPARPLRSGGPPTESAEEPAHAHHCRRR